MLKVAREIERQQLDEEIKTCRPVNIVIDIHQKGLQMRDPLITWMIWR